MSALALSDAARMLKGALKDRSYRATPLGLEVARYYRWKKNEWGAPETTLRDYEAILRRLAIYHADLELADFEPPNGTELVREVWDHYWGEAAARTRAKTLSVFRNFFTWAVDEGKMTANPALKIRRPKKRDSQRGTFNEQEIGRIINSQARLRDRVALQMLFRLGLRKGELTRFQFKHFDPTRARIMVQGKGGKIRYVPLVDDSLRLDLERHILEREARGDEYLLYPERNGPLNKFRDPVTGEAPYDLLWEAREQPMTSTTMHRWWSRCLERARMDHRPMHEARHTAITDLVRHTGNLKLAQQLAGHATIQTTADIYAHLDDEDLAKALRSLGRARGK